MMFPDLSGIVGNFSAKSFAMLGANKELMASRLILGLMVV